MKKSIAIFGEGITEWFYIDSLRIVGHYPFKMRPSIPQHSDIKHLLAEARQCVTEGYDEIICLLDMDRLNTHPSEKQAYHRAKQQRIFQKVTFIETDPCTEYWFLMHFMPKPSHRKYADYEAVAKELCKYMPGYEKTKKYFQRIRLYEFLSQHGDLEKALNLAKRSVELHDEGAEISYSQMYQLFKKLELLENKSKK
jgi:hypothetical protein